MSKEEKAPKLNPFEQSIKDYLDTRAAEDELFAVTYAKPNKSIKECCNYVMKCAKEGKRQGYTDEEVFGWAVHYYDEDSIKKVASVSGTVVVNKAIELSETDKEKAKQDAIKIATNEMVEKAKQDLKVNVELTEEEIADAKKIALDKVVADTQEKMAKKKQVKKPVEEKPETPTLF